MAEFNSSETQEDLPVNLSVAPGAIQQFKEVTVGAGSNVFKANAEGVFIGANNYTDAPISFSYDGDMQVKPGGSITVGGDTVIDDEGLNSVANFRTDVIQGALSQSISGTTYVDITGIVLDPLVLTRTTNVVFFMSFDFYTENFDFLDHSSYGLIRMYETGLPSTVIGPDAAAGENGSDIDWDTGSGTINSVTKRTVTQTYSDFSIYSLNAGTYNFKMQGKMSSADSGLITYGKIGYIVLGV